MLGRALNDPAAAMAATAAPRRATAPAGMNASADIPAAPMDTLPLPLRLLRRFPVLQGIPARLVAIGPLPEHAPDWARRTPDTGGLTRVRSGRRAGCGRPCRTAASSR